MFDPAQLPPQRADDALAGRVEEAGLNAAQPPEQLLFDGWLLRFSAGKARRARSINAIADGRLPLADRIAHCRRFYAEAGLPCLFRITPFSRPHSLDAALAERGFEAIEPTWVMVLSLSLPPASASPLPLRELDITSFARAAGDLRGSSADQVAAHAARLTASPLARQTRRLAVVDGDRVLAVGQTVREGDLVGLYDIVTAEAVRGRGLGTGLTTELLRRTVTDGSATAYLQVSADNAAARRIYRRLGFVDRYAYWYRTEPAPGGRCRE